MKKQLRIVFFAVLVLALLLAMGIFASAATTTEGAEDAYYKVVASDNATVTGYYSTLLEALNAVDGGTVYVMKNVPAEAVTKYTAAKSFTLDGQGNTITFGAFAAIGNGRGWFSIFPSSATTAWNVTMKNVTITGEDDETANTTAALLIKGGTNAVLTLEGVTIDTTWQRAVLGNTFRGTLNVNNSTIIGRQYALHFGGTTNSAGYTVNIKNSTVSATAANGAVIEATAVQSTPAAINVSGSSVLSGATIFNPVTVNKITVSAEGENVPVLKPTVALVGAKLTSTPSEVFDFKAAVFEVADVTVIPRDKNIVYSGATLKLPARTIDVLEVSSTVTVASQEDMDALIRACYGGGSDTYEEFGSVVYSGAGGLDSMLGKWIPIKVVTGGTLTISYGAAMTSETMFTVAGGILIITGGNYSTTSGIIIDLQSGGALINDNAEINADPEAVDIPVVMSTETGRIVRATAGILNVNGSGTYTSEDDSALFAIEGNATVNLNGGSFENKAGTNGATLLWVKNLASAKSVSLNGGTYKASRIVSLEDENSTVTVAGGTYISNSTSLGADNYMFNLLAPGKLVVRGNPQVIGTANTKAFFCANNSTTGAIIEISGGTFDGANCWLFSNSYKNNVTISGGTFKDTEGNLSAVIGAIYNGAFVMTRSTSTLTITGGSFTVPADKANFAMFEVGNVVIENATIEAPLVFGTGAVYSQSSGANVVATIKSGAVIRLTSDGELIDFADEGDISLAFEGGKIIASAVPDVGGVGTSQVDLVLTGFSLGKLTVTESATVATQEDLDRLIEKVYNRIIGTMESAFKSVSFEGIAAPQLSDYLGKWYPIVLDGEDAVLTIAIGGVLYDDTAFTVEAGTLNILGGSFSNTGSNLIRINGGTVNIKDGSFSTVAGNVIYVAGGKLTVDGGSFLTTKGTAVLYINAKTEIVINNGKFVSTQDANANCYVVYISNNSDGTTLTVNGGTFEGIRLITNGDNGTTVFVNGGTYRNNRAADFVYSESYFFNLTQPGKMFFTGNIVAEGSLAVKAFFAVNSSAADGTLGIYGGSYDGAQNWLFCNQNVTIMIGRKPIYGNPDDPTEITGYEENNNQPVFSDVNGNLRTPVGGTYNGAINMTKGTLIVSGGSFKLPETMTSHTIFEVVNATITGGYFEARTIFGGRAANEIEITGGEFYVMGAGEFAELDEDYVSNITVSGATIRFAQFNEGFFDKLSGAQSIKLDPSTTVIVDKLSGIVLDGEGPYTVSSLDDVKTLAAAYLQALAGETRLPLLQVGENAVAEGWIPITLRNANAVLTVKGGSYKTNVRFLFRIDAGELVIEDGEFVNAGRYGVYISGADTKFTMKGGRLEVTTRTPVYIGAKATFEMTGGHIYTNNDSGSTYYSCFEIGSSVDGAKVLLSGGTLESDASKGYLFIAQNGSKNTVVEISGTAELIKTTGTGIATYGGAAGAPLKFTMKGGKITAPDGSSAIVFYSPETEAVFEGGDVMGGTAINFNSKASNSSLTVKGGTYRALNANCIQVAAAGLALRIENGQFIQGEDRDGATYAACINEFIRFNATSGVVKSVEILGGTFDLKVTAESSYRHAVIGLQMAMAEDAAVTINGGTFNTPGMALLSFTKDAPTLKLEPITGEAPTNITFTGKYLVYANSTNAKADLVAPSLVISGGSYTLPEDGGVLYLGTNAIGFESITVSGGTIVGGDLFRLADGGTMTVSGGSFTVSGAGNYVIYLEGASTLNVTGGSFVAGEGTAVVEATEPYAFPAESTASFTINNNVALALSAAGTYTVAGNASYQAIFEAALPVVVYAATTAMPINVVADGVVLVFTDGSYEVSGGYLVRMSAGTLNITGGTYVANGGVVFSIQPGITAISVTGGSFTAAAKGTDTIYFDYRVDPAKASVTGGSFLIKDGAYAPMLAPGVFTEGASVTIEGNFGEFIFKTPGTYTFASLDEIKAYIAATATGVQTYFPTLQAVSLNGWGSIVINGAGVQFIITGGTYVGNGDQPIIRLVSGALAITGGSFTTASGSIIDVWGGTLAVSNTPVYENPDDPTAITGYVTPTFTVTPTKDNPGVAIIAEGDGAIVIAGGSFAAARAIVAENTATITIGAAASFVCNVPDSTELTGAYLIELKGDLNILAIVGGSFVGGPKTLALIAVTESGMGHVVAIAGEAVFDGADAWIYVEDAAMITICEDDLGKAPIFKDTNAQVGTKGHIDIEVSLNSATALRTQLLIKAGTFTASGSTPIVRVGYAEAVVEGGSFTGSTLFYLSQAPVLKELGGMALTIKGGDFVAEGADGYVIDHTGAYDQIYSASSESSADKKTAEARKKVVSEYIVSGGNLTFKGCANLPVDRNLNLENGFAAQYKGAKSITIIDPRYVQVSSRDQLAGLAGYDKYEKLLTITSATDLHSVVEKYYKTLFAGVEVTVTSTGWVPLHVHVEDLTVLFAAGEFTTEADYIVRVTRGHLIFTGGRFVMDQGKVVLFDNQAEYSATYANTLIIDMPTEAPTADQIAAGAVEQGMFVGDDANVLYTDYAEVVVIINGGRFIKKVIDATDYKGPLFTLYGAGTGSRVTINGGYFYATRVYMDYYAQAALVVNGGTFVSSFQPENYPINAETNAPKKPSTSNAYMFNARGTVSTMTFNGGSFDGGYSYAIVAVNAADGVTININGGTYDGGTYWVFTNRITTINVSNTPIYGDPADPTKVTGYIVPTFLDSRGDTVKYGFYSNAEPATMNFYGGKFDLASDGMKWVYMFYITAPTTINIYAGDFTIHPDVKGNGEKPTSSKFAVNGAELLLLYKPNGVANIYGGTFTATRIIRAGAVGCEVNIHGGKFISNAVHQNDANLIRIAANDTTLNITGGHILGNEHTYSLVCMNSAAGGTFKTNITGGTLEGGLRWILMNKPGTIIIDNPSGDPAKAPKFINLSYIVGGDSGTALHFTDGAAGGFVHIKVGDFRLPIENICTLLNAQGAEIVIEDGVYMEGPQRLIYLAGSVPSKLTIKGGTFRAFDNGNIFYFTSSKNSSEAYEGATITVENGTFIAEESASILYMSAKDPRNTLVFKNGTYSSESARMFFLTSAVGSNFIIENGTYTSTASRMIYVEESVTPMVIKGGTFHFKNKGNPLKNTDNALLYVTGKKTANVVIEGGTFIDERKGSLAPFYKFNEKASVVFRGSFKIYSSEMKTAFYMDCDNPVAYSIPMTAFTPVEALGDSNYYVCTNIYSVFAPQVVGAPVLRPNIGSQGIRFTSTVSVDTITELAKLGTVKYGTLIFPTEYLNGGKWDATTDFVSVLKAYAAANGIEESKVFALVMANDGVVTAEDGTLTIRAAIVNIKEANYARSFTGIAFAQVTAADGTVSYYYASHMTAGVSADMATIAYSALNEVNAQPIPFADGRVFAYTSIYVPNSFSRYTTRTQNELRKYLAEDLRIPAHMKTPAA